MAQQNGTKTAASKAATAVEETAASPVAEERSPDQTTISADPQALDETFAALKTLLSTVEKLQKARQDVGDIKPMLIRLLDGELLADEELEQLKSGVSGLSKLVRFYSDYQVALEKAQPARSLLDEVIKS